MLLSKTMIAERYGLTERQVRHRLTALDGSLTGHVSLGQGGQRVLDDYAVTLFDRLMQLEKEGLSTSAAVSRIRGEGSAIGNGSKVAPQRQPMAESGQWVSEELVEELRARLEDKDQLVKDLRGERDKLLSMLEEKDDQLRALMPGPRPVGESGNVKRMSRLQALKVLVLGR